MGRSAIRDQINLLYPPSCLHCDALLESPLRLCSECLELFTLLPEEGRCNKCFSSISMVSGVCKPCRKIFHPFRKVAACFDGYGPAQSLGCAFLKSDHYNLAKEIASYFVIQLDRLRFPYFPTITAVPSYFHLPLSSIGKELAHMLGCTFKPLLRRALTPAPRFFLKNGCNIINQNVLLIDLSLPSPIIMRAAAWTLDEGNPENIYGMTFCVT